MSFNLACVLKTNIPTWEKRFGAIGEYCSANLYVKGCCVCVCTLKCMTDWLIENHVTILNFASVPRDDKRAKTFNCAGVCFCMLLSTYLFFNSCKVLKTFRFRSQRARKHFDMKKKPNHISLILYAYVCRRYACLRVPTYMYVCVCVCLYHSVAYVNVCYGKYSESTCGKGKFWSETFVIVVVVVAISWNRQFEYLCALCQHRSRKDTAPKSCTLTSSCWLNVLSKWIRKCSLQRRVISKFPLRCLCFRALKAQKLCNFQHSRAKSQLPRAKLIFARMLYLFLRLAISAAFYFHAGNLVFVFVVFKTMRSVAWKSENTIRHARAH